MMREWCFKHQLLRDAGEQCGQCATEVCTTQQRDTLDILEARIADQDATIAGVLRQLRELRRIVLDLQRAHNLSVAS